MRRAFLYSLLVFAPFASMILPLAVALSGDVRNAARRPPQSVGTADASEDIEATTGPVMESVGKLLNLVGKDAKDVAALRHSLESWASSFEKSADVESAVEAPQVASAPAAQSEMLLKLRAFLEKLGIDVFKKVDDSVSRLNQESIEIEP